MWIHMIDLSLGIGDPNEVPASAVQQNLLRSIIASISIIETCMHWVDTRRALWSWRLETGVRRNNQEDPPI